MNSYLGVIPEELLRDDSLSANAKLLFAQITTTLEEDGSCTQSNIELAKSMSASDRAIRKWLEELKKNGYCEVVIEGKKRKILIQNKAEQIFQGGTNVPGKVERMFRVAILYLYNINNINNNTNKNNIKNNNVVVKKSKAKEFEEIVLNAYDHIVELFPKNFHPKDAKKKEQWLSVIDKMNRDDKVDPRTLYILVKLIRKDSFWRDQFLSLTKLKRRNKDGITYGQYFINRFRKELTDFYNDKKH